MSDVDTMEVVGESPEQPAQETPPQPEPAGDPLPQHVQEHYDAIRDKERHVRELESLYLNDKAAAKESKERFELADKGLRDLISRGPDPQRKLPLTDEPPADDKWKSAPLAELGMTEKINDLFAEAGVVTIGGLEEMRAAIADGKAEWPKGIGPVKVTDIENRVLDWLDEHRDHFGEPAAEMTDAEAEKADSDLADKCEEMFEKAGIADKIQRNVTVRMK